MNVTYVLGAGFSRAAGLPLINNFHESLITYHGEIARRYSQQVFDEYKRVINNGASIEDSFDTLEERGLLSDVFLLRAAVNAVIVAACERYLSTATDQQISLYSNFLNLVKNQNANIITLNYDTILECTDYISGIRARYIDKNDIVHGGMSFDYCLASWRPYRNRKSPLSFHELPFIKLHGGMNFFFCPVHKWAFYADITNSSHRNTCSIKDCKRNLEPGIIPPKLVKDISEFQTLWNIAKDKLTQSQQVTLIGVNLNERDQDFNDLIKDSVTSGDCEFGFINYKENAKEQDYDYWQKSIADRLELNIPRENISLDGFEPWIAQMNR